MEAAAVLGTLVLLASLQSALAWQGVDGVCCDWWTESMERPLGASQCPAALEGTNNATNFCGLCYAFLRSAFEEAWLGWEACLRENKLPVASASDYLAPDLAVVIPSVFLILFLCVWLWLKEAHGDPNNVSGRVGGLSSSFAHFQHYGTCSLPDTQTSAADTSESQDKQSESGVTNVQAYQSSGEDGDTLPPVLLMAAPEEPESGGDPEEPACGGDPEEPAASIDKAKLT